MLDAALAAVSADDPLQAPRSTSMRRSMRRVGSTRNHTSSHRLTGPKDGVRHDRRNRILRGRASRRAAILSSETI